MLDALVEAAERLERDGALPPVAAQPRAVRWIVQLDEAGDGDLMGPYERGDLRPLHGPDRGRSGTRPPPYLLVDKARYALSLARPGSEQVDREGHRDFVALLHRAGEETGDSDLPRIVAFLSRPLPEEFRRIPPDDMVTFRTADGAFPFERGPLRRFWSDYLAEELRAPAPATCLVCGERGAVLRIVPNSVVIFGQKCQITSFEQRAFRSFEKEQTANAPLCYRCASRAIQAIKHFTATPRHRATIVRSDKGGRVMLPGDVRAQVDPYKSQLAIFWLRSTDDGVVGPGPVDIEAALAAVLRGEEQERIGTPPPDLAQLDAFLRIPLTGKEAATNLGLGAFHLALLSANKTRLVVRDWFAVPIADLHRHLATYVAATRIADPHGGGVRPFSIYQLLANVASTDPTHARGLLRTAYQGAPPPPGLLAAAVAAFRKPGHLEWETSEERERVHAIAAALKLLISHGKEDAQRMEGLDPRREVPAYLCGRALAVVEEAQRRSAESRLNATLVDRLYTAVSAAPAPIFSHLLRLMETAYLPKLRRTKGGSYIQLRDALTEILLQLDGVGGFPRVLDPRQQAEFALGLYAQRGAFRSMSREKKGGQP